jgi:hypothetical protein
MITLATILIGSGLVSLVVAIVVLSLVYWLLTLLPLPAPFHQILLVIFVLIAILMVLRGFGIWGGGLAVFN